MTDNANDEPDEQAQRIFDELIAPYLDLIGRAAFQRVLDPSVAEKIDYSLVASEMVCDTLSLAQKGLSGEELRIALECKFSSNIL